MSCKKCQFGYLYTCDNCGRDAIYDYEFGAAFCDFCERLGEDYTTFSYECSDCNNSLDEIETNDKKFILFFDTETTGLPKDWDAPISDIHNWPRLVQLAYQVYDNDGNKIVEKDFIVYPDEFSIPQESTEIHGISNQIAYESGTLLSSVLSEFLSVIKSSHTIVGHNIGYDIKVVACELIRSGLQNPFENINIICTKESSTNFCAIDGNYGYKWPKLSELYFKLFRRNFEEAHNAAIDIQATVECFWELVKRKIIFIDNALKNETKPFLEPCFIEDGDEKKYGYWYSDTKKIAIKCQFEKTYPFIGNIAKVLYFGNINYITLNGIFIQPNESYRGSKSFSKGLVAAKASRELNPLSTEKMCGYIDIQSEEIIKIPFEFVEVREFINGFATVKKGTKWGIIDTNGNIKIAFIYDYLKEIRNDSFLAKKNNYWGIIDKENNEILSIIYDEYLFRGNEHIHTLSKDGKYGFYDININKFLGLNYDEASLFSEDCVPVKINGKWGYLDKNWVKIMPFEFDRAKSFKEAIAPVKKGDKWGYINKNGELLLTYRFRDAGPFRDGVAIVEYPLSWRQKIRLFMFGKYERLLHKININGESTYSWKALFVTHETKSLI